MMKTYKSSDLTHKRAEVLKEAKLNGVIIQQLETNGEVRQEYILMSKIKCDCLVAKSKNQLGVGDYYEEA